MNQFRILYPYCINYLFTNNHHVGWNYNSKLETTWISQEIISDTIFGILNHGW